MSRADKLTTAFAVGATGAGLLSGSSEGMALATAGITVAMFVGTTIQGRLRDIFTSVTGATATIAGAVGTFALATGLSTLNADNMQEAANAKAKAAASTADAVCTKNTCTLAAQPVAQSSAPVATRLSCTAQ